MDRIVDISELYYDEMSRDYGRILDNSYCLWIKTNNFPDLDCHNRELKELIINATKKYNFPEYEKIIYAAIDYYRHRIDHKGGVNINIFVDDKSELSKGHCNEKGYVRLFTIALEWNRKKKKVEFTGISFNVKLIIEKIPLGGRNKYPTKILDYENDTIENSIECSICLSNKGVMIDTNCLHKFHLECLKNVPNFLCPLCRKDIKECLIKNNVTEEEIKYKIEKNNKENEFENLCSAIDEVEINKLSDIDFIKLCMETLKLNNGDIIAYNDIIFDMNANASQLFAKISSIKSKKKRGVFAYLFDSPIEFIMKMKDPYSQSNVEWSYLSDYIETPFYDIVKNRVDRITNIDEEYVVMIIIENVINAHIVHKDAYKGEFAIRRHQRDILNSMIKLVRCKCSGNHPESPNREYRWAKKYLNKLTKNKKK